MRILVCGGRDFNERELVIGWLTGLHFGNKGPIDVLIHGAAKGADTLAAEWALRNNVPTLAYPADWTKYQHGVYPLGVCT